MLDLDTLIGEVQQARSLDELAKLLQRVIAGIGFESFNYLDTGHAGVSRPYFHGTCPPRWRRCYEDNGFISADPMVSAARRQRLPFTWGQVVLPERRSGPKPLAVRAMEAAFDHGYREGYVLPCHTVDQLGRSRSALTALFWRESTTDFSKIMMENRHALHVFLLYWQERVADFVWRHNSEPQEKDAADDEIRLTDRERDVLSWVARGKTTRAIAAILGISTETVEHHVRAAMEKMQASNRTAAAVKAVQLRLIDV
ncbi:LuxR family transcriptional regulator, quorum-sensing transcription factor LasR [Azospirillum sp. RU38E]|nr:LuxR family transcriptional regulator, quorum-sensing transcription factor LasR [Azospirillum sp. RU38E]SNT04896.1 LuxR family transcriptional regulator, quorum-sensing transcription factor LasR [Azospirillum sp. RU37A]